MAITNGEISFTEEPREIRVVTGEDVILPCHIRGVPAEERKNSGRVKIDVKNLIFILKISTKLTLAG